MIASTLLLVAVVAMQPLLPTPEGAQPKAVLSETIVDFGTLGRGDTASRTVTLENRGDAPLEIRHVKNNCACTVLDAPDSVAPGVKVELTLELDTETLNGPAQAIVNLFTNDPAAPRLDITVRVEARPYVWAEPAEFRYIVYRHFEGSGMVSAKVAGSSPSDFRITGIEVPGPHLTVTHREARPEERLPGPGTQYVLEAKLDPAAPVGPLTGWVRVATDHEHQKKLSIPLSGFVRPVLHVTPTLADLGTVTLTDEPLVWSHHVRNFATEVIEISRTETDIAGLSIAVREGSHDHEFYLELSLEPTVPKGALRGKITLHTTSPKVPTVEVPVKLTIE
ncbi:MAG TPA: DUF1573 domain-containing protein [Thermoanaerobaculia bacterium]|nr:DUF1573 domain-containing protein [Thermoanaerobaculia bacterium]